MIPVPIVYVSDMARARSFHSALSPDVTEVGAGPVWTEYRLGGATLALHLVERLSPAPSRSRSWWRAQPATAIADEVVGRWLT